MKHPILGKNISYAFEVKEVGRFKRVRMLPMHFAVGELETKRPKISVEQKIGRDRVRRIKVNRKKHSHVLRIG